MARLLINSYHALTLVGDYKDYFGWLYTPRIVPTNYNKPLIAHLPYAADNDAFNGLNEDKYNTLLQLLNNMNPMWITAPDSVGDYKETNRLFAIWFDKICRFPVAYVLQDGITTQDIPWDCIECVFLGGTTDFKLSGHARNLLIYAKNKGKLVHVGRVNSIKRIKMFWDICDSFDGSGFSRYSKAMLPRYIRFLDEEII